MKRIKLEGKRFGKLLVERYIGDCKYLCVCDCGNTTIVIGGNLTKGGTTSCGCLRRKTSTENNTKHGGHGTRLYGIWKAMKKRCTNTKDKEYQRYGGRGISVCYEWSTSFENFRDWSTENGYRDDLTIDRIDPDGNYEPANCRWVSVKEQSRNKRKSIFVTLDGVTKPLAEYAEIYGVPYNTALHRIKKQGLTPEETFKGERYGK